MLLISGSGSYWEVEGRRTKEEKLFFSYDVHMAVSQSLPVSGVVVVVVVVIYFYHLHKTKQIVLTS